MALLTLLVLAAIVGLGALLALREPPVLPIRSASVASFALLAALALSALFVPGAYRGAADLTLEAMGVKSQIEALDERLVLNDIVDASGDAIEAFGQLSVGSTSVRDLLGAFLGQSPERAEGEAGDSAGSDRNEADGAGAPANRPPTRILSDSVYPGLVAVVAAVFRIGAVVVALAGMLAVTAIALASSALGELRTARNTQRDLEARVTALEARLTLGSGGPPDAAAAG